MLLISKMIRSLRTCPLIPCATSFRNVWLRIILLKRPAPCRASPGPILLINIVFWLRYHASIRVTGSSTTDFSITKYSYMFQLLEEPVQRSFGAITDTLLHGILAESIP
jgi:hypothetical protein